MTNPTPDLATQLALEQGVCKGLEFRLLEVGHTLEEVLEIGIQSCRVVDVQADAMKRASKLLQEALSEILVEPILDKVIMAMDALDDALAVE